MIKRDLPSAAEQRAPEPSPGPGLRKIVIAPGAPVLRADGTRIVDSEGEQVILRGCNLGNWLMLEMWMLDWRQFHDQYELEATLSRRFGEAEKDRLLDIHRANWIKPRDFDIIRSFGFNVVRLPFNYRLLEDDRKPFELKKDAFKWLDRAVQMARRANIYVILDMHGTPGGQSNDHTTGRAGQNRFWEPENKKRTAWLWKQIAAHFRDSPVVAAYDIINEPFGDWKTDVHLNDLVDVVEMIYDSIRSVDQDHLIFIPGGLHGMDFYGSPEDHGWENVGFTEHYYPGLFGSEPSLETHGRFMARRIPWRAVTLKKLQVPFLVGEFNVVFHDLGGSALMRAYCDAFASHGWAATMWCYKLLQKAGGLGEDNWYMVKNLEPLPPVSPRTSSLEELENYFRWLGSMDYAVYENLGAAMTVPNAPPVNLPSYTQLPFTPPAEDELTTWQATDIGGATRGGQKVRSETELEIYGGGADIWGDHDQFRFTWQDAPADFYLSATLESLADSHMYAKAGLMLRQSLEPDSAHFLINIFPDGEISVGWRSEPGGEMKEKSVGGIQPPVKLRLVRRGEYLEAAFSDDGRTWERTRIHASSALRLGGHAGLVVLSHDKHYLTIAEFSAITFRLGRGSSAD